VPCDPLLTRGRLPPRVQREKAFINQSTGVLQRFDFEPAGRIDPALFGLIRESCCGRLVGGKVKIRSFGPAMFVLFFFLDYFSSCLRWAADRCLCVSRRWTPPAGTSSWSLYHPTALPSSCRLLFCPFFYSDPLHAKSASSRPRELEPLLEGEGDAFTFGLPRENYTYSMLRGLTLNFTRF
jgi:hypothetical protein